MLGNSVKLCLYTSVLVGMSMSLYGQIEARSINQAFSHFTHTTPGAVVVIYRDGHVIYQQGYGMADLEHDIPMTASSIFHVASVSKEFAAMSIVLLAQEGKLSLDDDIRKYLPEVPDFRKTITIRHLLNHTSGLRDQWTLLSLAGWRRDDLKTQEDVLKLVKRQQELNFNPGDEYLYSNTGFTLLAYIVERTSGSSLKEFSEENIFRPIGMQHTHFHNDHTHLVKNRTYAYTPRPGGGYRFSVPVFDTYGATSLFTTAGDLALWADNLLLRKVGGEAGVKMLFTQGKLNNGETLDYALGIRHGEYRGLKTIGHSGSDAGYRSNFLMFPEQNVAIVVLSNVSTGNPGQLTHEVADAVLKDHFTEERPKTRQQASRRERKTLTLTADQLSQYVGKYYSEELDVFYTLEIHEDRLVRRHRKMADASMQATEKDGFFAGRTDYKFTRNAQGQIDGYRLTSGRVRNLKFLRLKDAPGR